MSNLLFLIGMLCESLAGEPTIRKDSFEVLLNEHRVQTEESILISTSETEKDSSSLFEDYKKFASRTKKPSNAILIRIQPHFEDFEIFKGLGIEEKLSEDKVEKIKTDFHKFSNEKPEIKKLYLTIRLLEALDTPLDLNPYKALLQAYSPEASFSVLNFILTTLFIIIVLLAIFFYTFRALFSELFISAYSEKRISPYFGVLNKSNHQTDLINGGGVSGHYGE